MTTDIVDNKKSYNNQTDILGTEENFSQIRNRAFSWRKFGSILLFSNKFHSKTKVNHNFSWSWQELLVFSKPIVAILCAKPIKDTIISHIITLVNIFVITINTGTADLFRVNPTHAVLLLL